MTYSSSGSGTDSSGSSRVATRKRAKNTIKKTKRVGVRRGDDVRRASEQASKQASARVCERVSVCVPTQRLSRTHWHLQRSGSTRAARQKKEHKEQKASCWTANMLSLVCVSSPHFFSLSAARRRSVESSSTSLRTSVSADGLRTRSAAPMLRARADAAAAERYALAAALDAATGAS